jgi:small subunit ribosomal protein S14
MARLSSIHKNKHRVRLAAKKEVTRRALKDVVMNRSLPFEERIVATQKLARMPRNSSKVRIRNRCELTGRSRGYYRFFKISRIELRRLANSGQLPGVVKASW